MKVRSRTQSRGEVSFPTGSADVLVMKGQATKHSDRDHVSLFLFFWLLLLFRKVGTTHLIWLRVEGVSQGLGLEPLNLDLLGQIPPPHTHKTPAYLRASVASGVLPPPQSGRGPADQGPLAC